VRYWPKPVRAATVEMLTGYHADDADSIAKALTESDGVSPDDVIRCLLDLVLVLVLVGQRHDGDVDAGLRELGQTVLEN
jgi:hypothetical protein